MVVVDLELVVVEQLLQAALAVAVLVIFLELMEPLTQVVAVVEAN
jgi:hypothetical protein